MRAGESIIACCVGHICLFVGFFMQELGAAAEGMVATLLTCTSNADLYFT